MPCEHVSAGMNPSVVPLWYGELADSLHMRKSPCAVDPFKVDP